MVKRKNQRLKLYFHIVEEKKEMYMEEMLVTKLLEKNILKEIYSDLRVMIIFQLLDQEER